MKKIVKWFSIVFILFILVGCAEQRIHMDVTYEEVTIKVTDIVNNSIRDEEQVEELISKYESLGYTVEEYDGSDDGMVGVIYSKKFNLSDVSSEDDVVFHLEPIGTKELKNPKLFTVKKGLLSTTYKASMVYDTKNAEVDGFSKEELEENASSIDITYSVTLPKKAKKHNADSVDDKTYTWKFSYGNLTEINYEFQKMSPLFYIVISLAIVIIIIGIVIVVKKVINNRKTTIVSVEQPPTEPLNENVDTSVNPGYVIPVIEKESENIKEEETK